MTPDCLDRRNAHDAGMNSQNADLLGQNVIHNFGTPKIYTTTGLGPRKKREMAGVDDLVVYMQTAVKYNTFYIHHPGGVVVYIFGVPNRRL